MVVNDDADSIALANLNRRSRSAAVVPPEVDNSTGNDFLLHRFGDEMEFLHVSVHPKRKFGNIRRQDRNRNAPSILRRCSFSLSFRQYLLSPVTHTCLLGRERFGRSEYSCPREKVLQEPTPAAHVFLLTNRIS